MFEFFVIALVNMAQNPDKFTLPYHQDSGISIFEPVPNPQKNINRIAPHFLENPKLALLAQDNASGKYLYEKNASRSQHIASLSKLITYAIIRKNHKLDDVVSIPYLAAQTQGAKLGLYEHETLTVKTLLEALLITSSNDAAVALAIFDSGEESIFAKKMKVQADEWDLRSAEFYNSTGLDILDEEKSTYYGNKMSAYDILKVARQLLSKDDFFRKTVATKHFYGTSTDGEFFHEKKSTNPLLEVSDKIKGVKTGYTILAGQCFISLAENDKGNEILTVVLGSEDRFGQTQDFIAWILDAWNW